MKGSKNTNFQDTDDACAVRVRWLKQEGRNHTDIAHFETACGDSGEGAIACTDVSTTLTKSVKIIRFSKEPYHFLGTHTRQLTTINANASFCVPTPPKERQKNVDTLVA